jgi:ubiquinone/menaquinone biosynthesis C-methylase UbiE
MGAGLNLQLYGPYVDRIVGVDINSAMHPYAQQAAEAAGVGHKLQLLTGRTEALPLESASADAVVMTHVSV